MKRIVQLHPFLVGLAIVAAEKIDSFIDEGETEIIGCYDPEYCASYDEIAVSITRYTATFFIAHFPQKRKSADLLFAQISAWLINQDLVNTAIQPDDATFVGNKFSWNVDILNDDAANIEIRIPFREVVIASAADNGEIELDGKRYSLNE